MKFSGFEYEVKLVVEFTPAEVALLSDAALRHYDATCVEAALAIGEPHPHNGEHGTVRARVNGFIAQLRLFRPRAAWRFREFDIAAKCLEPYTQRSDAERELLGSLMDAMTKIQQQHRKFAPTPLARRKGRMYEQRS